MSKRVTCSVVPRCCVAREEAASLPATRSLPVCTTSGRPAGVLADYRIPRGKRVSPLTAGRRPVIVPSERLGRGHSRYSFHGNSKVCSPVGGASGSSGARARRASVSMPALLARRSLAYRLGRRRRWVPVCGGSEMPGRAGRHSGSASIPAPFVSCTRCESSAFITNRSPLPARQLVKAIQPVALQNRP